MQVTASSNEATVRDRTASEGIILKTGGEFVWSNEMTADAPI